MSRRALDAVARAHRASKAGDGLLSQSLADHVEDIARALGVDGPCLLALDVEHDEGRRQLGELLARSKTEGARRRLMESCERRALYAGDLVRSAQWRDGVLELGVPELFAFVASAGARVLRLETSDFVVYVDRPLLVRARGALARLPNPTASLDAEALHLRWRDGRGGLHVRCSPPAPRDEPAFLVRFDCPRVARPPVLLAEVLRDLGLTA